MTADDIVIRDINGPAEMRLVEELQKDVWGLPDLDVVPLTQLVAAKAAGGIVIGAFDRSVLAGFAYGFVGREDVQVTHHSHMLGVQVGYRSFNIGYRLKLAQRERALAQGLRRMTWTFDPLQSVNAYFNFNKLGVVSNRYLVDFYGDDAASFLHRSGTDRLWVTWLLDRRHVCERLEGAAPALEIDAGSLLVEVGKDQEPRRTESAKAMSDEKVVIEIPADINSLDRKYGELTAQWREVVRTAFIEATQAGYLINGFYRGDRDGHIIGRYLLQRGGSIGEIE